LPVLIDGVREIELVTRRHESGTHSLELPDGLERYPTEMPA